MRRRRVGPARVPARLPLDRGSAVYSMIHPCTRIILLPPHHRLVNLIIHRACDASAWAAARIVIQLARTVGQAGRQSDRPVNECWRSINNRLGTWEPLVSRARGTPAGLRWICRSIGCAPASSFCPATARRDEIGRKKYQTTFLYGNRN